jgi:citronellol/citronellal dehydrogenase
VFAEGALGERVAVVTGGGTNLGKAAAGELVRWGAAAGTAGRRGHVLEQAPSGIEERRSWMTGDIREAEGAEVHAALERHGRLDYLLNNAGGQYLVPAEGIITQGLASGSAPEHGGP